MSQLDLTEIRQRIDDLDEQIQSLIMQRARLAEDVAKAKHAAGDNRGFYRPEREAEVLRKVLQRNRDSHLPDAFMVRLFREIMSACLALQNPLQIAFLGPEGTYSHAAVLKHFGHGVEPVPVPTIEEVFREVEAGNVDYGVVPVENSSEGGVNQTLEKFIQSPLRICGEVDLPIHHYLLSKAGDLREIQCIYAHPQALGQCRVWLDTHLPGIRCIALNSNAEAALRAAEEPQSAAIAGKTAAELYALEILAKRIEDHLDNTTRFAILGHQEVPVTGRDKTSLLLSAPNRPGSLYQLLAPLAENSLSMSRIESRPSRRGTWDYVFYVDIEGHSADPLVNKALSEIEKRSVLYKNLGSYPRALDTAV